MGTVQGLRDLLRGYRQRMIYKVPVTTKKIVRAALQDTAARSKRRAAGKLTKFDKMMESATKAARGDMIMPGFAPEIKNIVTDKIIDSIANNEPWERMGDTYCGREMFYNLRLQYIYHVAVRMGIICEQSTRKRR